MDAIMISFTTKEGIHVVSWADMNKDGDTHASVNVWDLADKQDDDYCPDTQYKKSCINVYSTNTKDKELTKKLDEIIFKRIHDDAVYFKKELGKLGLTLAESDFDPCKDCQNPDKRDSCTKDFSDIPERMLREYRSPTQKTD
jgi:hypothetical protein